MCIFSFMRNRRNKVKRLEGYIKTLEKTLEETAPKGPYLRVNRDDGYTYVYQCVGRVVTPHWTDSMVVH